MYLSLIVVNCIILGRAEAFASKNSVAASAVDGICQGIGYTVVLLSLDLSCSLISSASVSETSRFSISSLTYKR